MYGAVSIVTTVVQLFSSKFLGQYSACLVTFQMLCLSYCLLMIAQFAGCLAKGVIKEYQPLRKLWLIAVIALIYNIQTAIVQHFFPEQMYVDSVLKSLWLVYIVVA